MWNSLLHRAMPTSLKAKNTGMFTSKKYWALKQIVKDNFHVSIRATFFRNCHWEFLLMEKKKIYWRLRGEVKEKKKSATRKLDCVVDILIKETGWKLDFSTEMQLFCNNNNTTRPLHWEYKMKKRTLLSPFIFGKLLSFFCVIISWLIRSFKQVDFSMLHSISLRFGIQVLTPMFRSSSNIAAKTKSRRDVSSTVHSQAPAKLHWSTQAAEPGTAKASAAPKMKQKQSQPKGRKSNSMTLDCCDQNEKWNTQEGQGVWLWGRTEPPADPHSPVGGGWVLPLCSPTHFSQIKKSPLSPQCLISWNSWLTCMPDHSPELLLS